MQKRIDGFECNCVYGLFLHWSSLIGSEGEPVLGWMPQAKSRSSLLNVESVLLPFVADTPKLTP